jgi:TRAP transporter 4TM/12TM fusion protein
MALYTGATGPFQPPVQRSLFLLILLPLLFMRVPSGLIKDTYVETVSGLILGALSIFVMAWYIIDYERLAFDPFINHSDVVVGIIGLILVLESVRRTVGMLLTLFLSASLAFAYFGNYMPTLFRHSGLSLHEIVSNIYFGTDGVFGTPVGVTSTFIVMIVMLGAFLSVTGGVEMFMDITKAIAGRFVGGPAKMAVVGSAMMGTITGATVANVATTGAITIPLMKRSGYQPAFAGAVEALASSGGQLMPPIMGAAAFIMIDFLNMNYIDLMVNAVVPSFLFFFSVYIVIHVRSVKRNLKPLPKSEIPTLGNALRQRGHMLLPLVLLVYLLIERFGIMYVAFFAVLSAIVLSYARSTTRLGLKGFYQAFDETMNALIPLVGITAGSGILIGVLSATGLNLKITYLIEYVAQGSLFVTLLTSMVVCIILGMGLPTVAAYLILAALVPTSIINLGIPPVAAHLFIFYFAILSAITPPVCTGAYVAAGIANADPMKTAYEAIRLGLIVYLLPFAFVYSPSLILIGSLWDSAISITTCIIGITFWAYGLEGFVRQPIGPLLRAAFLLSGVLLVWPVFTISMVGLVVGTIAGAVTLLSKRRGHAV